MARSRNVKPGFFSNEKLSELPWQARLLFIGLWTVCDRAGRVEDRPKKIKAVVFPYDDGDVDAMLSMLQRGGFVVRYEAAGTRLIQVVNWHKHQAPHFKEAASTWPPPPEPCASPGLAPDEPGADPGLAADEPLPLPERAALIPDSLNLIPDSFNRIPDCLNPIPDSIHPPTPVGVVPPATKLRASRKCPASFVVTPDLIAWAASEAPGVLLDTETAKLRDHTFKNAISDWPGAWRNWMRKAQGFAQQARTGRTATPMKTFAEREADYMRAQVAAWSGGLLGNDPKVIDMGVADRVADTEGTHAVAKRLG